MRRNRILLAAALATVLLAATGCDAFVRRVPRPMREDTRSVPLSGAKSVEAEIRMLSGEMRVRGGAEGAMDARFEYNRDDWRPLVDYSVLGDEGLLGVHQADRGEYSGLGSSRNAWDVRLTEEVPLDLSIQLGAGKSNLDLGDLDLRDLQVKLGAGETTIDLDGIRNDVTARVEGGAGEFTLIVPKEIGVKVVGAEDGLGEVNAEGFEREGGALVNNVYGTAKTNIEIALRFGAGEVNLLMAD